MGTEGTFPISLVVTGFFVVSLAYLICFCCCIIQFFVRRSNALSRANRDLVGALNILEGQQTSQLQRNDTLKRKLMKQFRNSLRRFRRQQKSEDREFPCDTGTCPICFDEYKADPAEELIGYIKHCGHYFHFDCIWTWLEKRSSCPLCRDKVALKEEDIKGISLRHLRDIRRKNAQSKQNGAPENNNNNSRGIVNLAFCQSDENITSSTEVGERNEETASSSGANNNNQEMSVWCTSNDVITDPKAPPSGESSRDGNTQDTPLEDRNL